MLALARRGAASLTGVQRWAARARPAQRRPSTLTAPNPTPHDTQGSHLLGVDSPRRHCARTRRQRPPCSHAWQLPPTQGTTPNAGGCAAPPTRSTTPSASTTSAGVTPGAVSRAATPGAASLATTAARAAAFKFRRETAHWRQLRIPALDTQQLQRQDTARSCAPAVWVATAPRWRRAATRRCQQHVAARPGQSCKHLRQPPLTGITPPPRREQPPSQSTRGFACLSWQVAVGRSQAQRRVTALHHLSPQRCKQQ